mgnify:CR=1 FL=1
MRKTTNIKYIALMTVAMSLVWIVSAGVLMGIAGHVQVETVDLVDSAISSLSLVLVSLLNVLVIAWFINRSHLHGFKLAVRVFFLMFGVMFFMTQIETLFFNSAVQMPLPVVLATFGSGAMSILVVALLAIPYRRKLGPVTEPTLEIAPSGNGLKLLALGLIYMVFYFVFGYYTAWQVPGLRAFYTGSTEIAPFGQHMVGILRSELALPVFQIVRGLMWAGFGLAALTALTNAKAWERTLLVGLLLSVGLATPLFVPNEFMPPIVRLGHFFELLAENFLFGVLVALFFRPSLRTNT